MTIPITAIYIQILWPDGSHVSLTAHNKAYMPNDTSTSQGLSVQDGDGVAERQGSISEYGMI